MDVWAEWKKDKAIITQVRRGFSAEQAGLKVGMQIIAINGSPVETAVRNRLGVSLRRVDEATRNWALRALLAGTHDTRRVVEAQRVNGLNGAVFDFELPNTKIKLNYAAEKLFHVNGTLREDFVPAVAVKLSDKRTDDVILGQGIRTLRGLLKRRPASHSNSMLQ